MEPLVPRDCSSGVLRPILRKLSAFHSSPFLLRMFHWTCKAFFKISRSQQTHERRLRVASPFSTNKLG